MTRREQQTSRPEKMSNFFGGSNFSDNVPNLVTGRVV